MISFITIYDSYYNLRQLLQIMTVIKIYDGYCYLRLFMALGGSRTTWRYRV